MLVGIYCISLENNNENEDEYPIISLDELGLPPFDEEDYNNAKKAVYEYELHCITYKDKPRPGNYLKDYAAYNGVKNMDLLKLAQMQCERENEKHKNK